MRNSDYERKARLSELFKEILADTLRLLDEPNLEFVTITGVEVDNSLSRAQIHITCLDFSPEQEKLALDALEKNANVFRKAISTQSRIRQMPKLVFSMDEGLKASAKIDEILKNLDIKDLDTKDLNAKDKA